MGINIYPPSSSKFVTYLLIFILLIEDAPIEDSGVTEGADEEICLLPDTEREISEADKAAAEKVLAEKRKLAEEG